MRVRTPLAASLLTGGLLVVGMAGTAAAADPVCDAYSGTCTTPPGGGSGGTGTNGSSTNGTTTGAGSSGTSGNELPFTGGEVVLISLVGAAALAGGTVLVVAGRRRNDAGSVG